MLLRAKTNGKLQTCKAGQQGGAVAADSQGRELQNVTSP